MLLTDRQRQTLAFFREFVEANGVSPKLGEVSEALGCGKVTTLGHFQALVARGLIVNRHPHRARGYELTDQEDTRESRLEKALKRLLDACTDSKHDNMALLLAIRDAETALRLEPGYGRSR